MNTLRPYDPARDKRSGTNSHRRGRCSTKWCREPATSEWTTNGGKTRYVCAHHETDVVEVDLEQGGLIAAGAGDGVYHSAPFLKKYGG